MCGCVQADRCFWPLYDGWRRLCWLHSVCSKHLQLFCLSVIYQANHTKVFVYLCSQLVNLQKTPRLLHYPLVPISSAKPTSHKLGLYEKIRTESRDGVSSFRDLSFVNNSQSFLLELHFIITLRCICKEATS